MDSKTFHETVNSYISTLQNLKDYVEKLENSNNSMYDASSWEFNLDTLESTKVPEFITVLYHPVTKLVEKNKCSKCDSNRLIKLNDSNFFNHYRTCDCFNNKLLYEVEEIFVIRIEQNGPICFYQCYEGENKVFINSSKILSTFSENDLLIPTDSVYYMSKENCITFVDAKNNKA